MTDDKLETAIWNLVVEVLDEEADKAVAMHWPLGGAHPSKNRDKYALAEPPAFVQQMVAEDVPLDTRGRSIQEAAYAALKSVQRTLREIPPCPEHGDGVVYLAHTPVHGSSHRGPASKYVDIYLHCTECERKGRGV